MRSCARFLLSATCVLVIYPCLAVDDLPGKVLSEQRHKEFAVERELGRAVMSWLADGNEVSAGECDDLVNSLLSIGEPTARSYFIAAQVASLRGKTPIAITALENAAERCPDERAPGVSLPVRIVAPLWIGTIARQSGDIPRAQRAYELVLSKLDDVESKECITMICNLYLAEMESDNLKRDADALHRLAAAANVAKPDGPSAPVFHMYSAWAKYRRAEISEGRAQAASKLVPYAEVMSTYAMIALQLKLTGIVASPLAGCCGRDKRAEAIGKTIYDRILQSGRSSIDEDLVRLVYGFVYQQNRQYVEAEEYYLPLFQKGTFLSPIAGIYLANCKKAQNAPGEAEMILEQASKRYPGYDSLVMQIRQSSR
jgi:tetratricopeptide (TPR) repeat protein